jgi:hypothetical protein
MRRSESLPIVVLSLLAFGMATSWCGAAAGTIFTISVNFGSGLTANEEAVFAQAADYWDSVITGYKPGITGITGVTIGASGQAIDGVGGILGSASVDGAVIRTASNGTTYRLATNATMTFDSADLDNMYNQGYLYPVILHEMGHAIGFGTVWTNNAVYVNGSGQYTGAAALAAYRSEFVGQSGAAYVPVELGGGGGTANAHWNEGDGGGATGIVDHLGRDMEYELMTGWLNLPASSVFVSQTTIHSFEDIGYMTVPEPSAFVLLGIGVVSILGYARRLRVA